MPTTNTASLPSAADVVAFWREAGPSRWFRKDAAFDDDFRQRFLAAHEAAVRGELAAWESSGEGVLALLLLLDQFPRNCFRQQARAFANDPQALAAAERAVAAGLDTQVDPALRLFVYLPFTHAESLPAQDRAVALQSGLPGGCPASALEHREIIRRFGRFPHRNPVLGRTTTPDEKRYLDAGGFAG